MTIEKTRAHRLGQCRWENTARGELAAANASEKTSEGSQPSTLWAGHWQATLSPRMAERHATFGPIKMGTTAAIMDGEDCWISGP